MTADDAAPDRYKLPVDQAQRIFDEQIKPQLTGESRSQPVVVFIGGQPGSGKSTAQLTVMDQLGRQHAVQLDGDELLAHHPQYEALARTDDLTASWMVHLDGTQWWRQAVEHIKAERLDVVISSPIADATWAGDQMRAFRDAGYRVEVAVVAVHEAQSLLGIVHRYQSQRDAEGFGRWVRPEAHDRAYPGVLDTVDRVDREQLADAVHVLRRGGEVIYSNQLDANGQWQHQPRTRAAIEQERARPWDRNERQQFMDRAAALVPRVSETVGPVLRKAAEAAVAHRQAATPPARLGTEVPPAPTLASDGLRRSSGRGGVDRSTSR